MYLKREEYVISQAAIAAARSVSSMFEASMKDAEEQEYPAHRLEEVARAIAKSTSKDQLENLMVICNMAVKINDKFKGSVAESG